MCTLRFAECQQRVMVTICREEVDRPTHCIRDEWGGVTAAGTYCRYVGLVRVPESSVVEHRRQALSKGSPLSSYDLASKLLPAIANAVHQFHGDSSRRRKWKRNLERAVNGVQNATSSGGKICKQTWQSSIASGEYSLSKYIWQLIECWESLTVRN